MLTDQQFRKFVRKRSDELFRYAYFFLGKRSDAEDVLQEMWIKLWSMRADIDLERNPEALVFSMLKNKCLDHLRRATRNPFQTREHVPEIPSSSHALSEMEAKETLGRLMDFIQTLPELQRDILILRNIEGYSIEKIAEITDLKINTVEVYLSRARRKLRKAYLTLEENER